MFRSSSVTNSFYGVSHWAFCKSHAKAGGGSWPSTHRWILSGCGKVQSMLTCILESGNLCEKYWIFCFYDNSLFLVTAVGWFLRRCMGEAMVWEMRARGTFLWYVQKILAGIGCCSQCAKIQTVYNGTYRTSFLQAHFWEGHVNLHFICLETSYW